eukprot:scaffold78917_cov33-Tisochrysis_lutea.AAC.11
MAAISLGVCHTTFSHGLSSPLQTVSSHGPTSSKACRSVIALAPSNSGRRTNFAAKSRQDASNASLDCTRQLNGMRAEKIAQVAANGSDHIPYRQRALADL